MDLQRLKTHTFKLGRYHVEIGHGIEGCCDTPYEGSWKRSRKDITVLEGKSLKALIVAIHEALHAENVPENIVHSGTPDRIARFLWRLGWRLK